MTEKSNNQRQQKKSDNKNKSKKPYRTPQLEIYGTLVGLTSGVGNKSADHARPKSKT